MAPSFLPFAARNALGRRLGVLALLAFATAFWTGCARLSARQPSLAYRGVVQVVGRGEVALSAPLAAETFSIEPVDLAEAGQGELLHADPTAGSAPLLRPGKVFPSWGSRSLDLPVVVALPPEAGSRVEAVMIARRKALDEALRRLAAYVAQLPSPEGNDTVGDRLRNDGDLARRVETLIRLSLETPAQGEIEGGSYALKVRLRLEPVALEMWGEVVPPSDASLTRAAPASADPLRDPALGQAGSEESKGKARALALADARRIMLEQLKQESLFPSYTVEDLMLADDAAARQVRAMPESGEIVEERYPAPNVCEIVLSLDFDAALNRLRR